MFHLHSLKDPPPEKMYQAINFTSEVEATMSSQESQSPPIPGGPFIGYAYFIQWSVLQNHWKSV